MSMNRDVHYTKEERIKILHRFGLSDSECQCLVNAIEDMTFLELDATIEALMTIAKRRKPLKLE